ncbi:MAG TPA: tripartite tricarboxylate transporter substrate binding protein [Burkholderiales bacterium]|jgi:tripartite-type tricarboxylate transporter receptor subunit TctC|nr:tripartite tricarboxylate transporter substrate binding protein [Burkholderiales bacterium]
MIKRAFALAAAATLAAAASGSSAQSYPNRPVRILVPFPAGAGVDIVARMLGLPLTDLWGQAAVVDNRPGAGGTIACELAAKAAPDGYTLLLGNISTFAMAPSLYKKVNYDPVQSFAPITLVNTSANVLVAHPSVPATTTQALIALAKAKPGQINYASAGSGTSPHLAAELFKSMAGVDLVHVPYKGSPQALTDLLGGQTQIMFASLVSALPHIRQTRLRALGVTSLKRAAALPDLPAISEAGLRGYDVSVWMGIVAPAGTPPAIIAQLNRQIAALLQSPDIRERLAVQGLEAASNSPAEFRSYIASEVRKWAVVIKQAGVVAD